jgi:hemerythrin-like domain-containing protein
MRDTSLIPLSYQHNNCLELCALTDRSLKEDRDSENVARLAKRVIERYRVELTNHFSIEEQLLFALCASELTAQLTEEHRDIERFVEQLRSEPSAEVLEQFAELLSRHIRCEEDEFYDQIQKTLPRRVLDEVGRLIKSKVVRVTYE